MIVQAEATALQWIRRVSRCNRYQPQRVPCQTWTKLAVRVVIKFMATSLGAYIGWYVACGAALLLASLRSRFYSVGYAIFIVLAILPLLLIGSAHIDETKAMVDHESSLTFRTFGSTAAAFPMASFWSLLMACMCTLDGSKRRAPVWFKGFLLALALMLLALIYSAIELFN